VSFCIFLVFFLLSGSLWAESKMAGRVVFSRGSIAALSGSDVNARPRLLGKEVAIYESDVIQTGPDSFAIIEFIDKARMTVRPNTSFRVEKYTREGQQEAKLNLYKGGFRANGGEIAQHHPDRFQVETPLATIKPKSGEFSAQLCDNDCQTGNDTQSQTSPIATPNESAAVARVIQLQGQVEADHPQGRRGLQLGSPIFEQDRILTQSESYAILLFRDSSKVTVQPHSEFLISEYRYEVGGKNNRSLLKLLSGGIRALTGMIGKENRKNYQVSTPVATIGIRGTGFDLACQGDCIGEEFDMNTTEIPEGLNQTKPDGLYSYVWQHAITLHNEAGSFDLEENHAIYIANAKSSPIALPQIPDLFLQNPAPKPDQVKAQADRSSKAKAHAPARSGLYVSVKNSSGAVEVKDQHGKNIQVTTQGGAYVSAQGDASLVSDADDLIAEDHLPSPSVSSSEASAAYSLLVDDVDSASTTRTQFQCKSQ
jgi:hypothetical protein